MYNILKGWQLPDGKLGGNDEGKYAISRENLANKSLRNCDVRHVLCILTIFCRFKLKNVCILPKFLTFQSFQSKIILVKCCKEVIVPPE